MLKSARASLLLLVMAWQVLAALTPFGADRRAGEIAHVWVHGQEVGHHHHADQSLHLEDGEAALPHEHAGFGAQPVGMLPTLLVGLAEFNARTPAPGESPDHPSAFLEGPLRPPRHLA